MPKPKIDVLGKAEKSIELISLGLTQLEECNLEGLSGARYIDVVARLNTQSGAIDKIVRPLKDSIKVRILEDNPGSNSNEFVEKGSLYQAKVRRIQKTIIVADKVRQKLGRLITQVQETVTETQLTFGVKE